MMTGCLCLYILSEPLVAAQVAFGAAWVTFLMLALESFSTELSRLRKNSVS